VDKARLRENAWIVRTLQGDLTAAHEAVYERKVKEMYEKIQASRQKGWRVRGE